MSSTSPSDRIEPAGGAGPASGTTAGAGGKGGTGGKHTAGAFDVRSVIAGLIGLYGLVLLVYGLVDRSEEALAKAGGVNANLWTGIVMLVVAAGFGLWVRLRPVVVDAPPAGETPAGPAGH